MLVYKVKSDEGFSIAEIVWAAVVLFIVAMGVLGAMTFAATSTQSSSIRVSALNLANQRLEQARALPYDEVGTYREGGEVGDPPGAILTPETVGGRFTVDTDVSWARDEVTGLSLYKQITVTVSWDEGPGGTVSVSSNLFGKSELVNTGDVEIEVRDEATNELVPGAKVTITPTSGTARTVYTDADGIAFYGHLPTGSYTVGIVKAGYIFDPTQPAGTVTVTADLLSKVVAYIEAPSTLRVTVTSDGTSPLAGASLRLVIPGLPTRNASSDGNGLAVFSDLPTGDFQLRVEYTGRAPVQQSVSIPAPGTVSEITIVMPSRQGFVARVVDSSSNALPGATVVVRGPSPSNGHIPGSPGTTASNGEVSFGTPADGTYTITASLAGYTTVTRTVTYDGSVGLFQVMLSQETPGSLQIRTVDRRGRSTPLQWVSVTGPNYNRLLQTDATGYITLTGLTPGTYTVVGRESQRSYTVQVLAGEASYVEVRTP